MADLRKNAYIHNNQLAWLTISILDKEKNLGSDEFAMPACLRTKILRAGMKALWMTSPMIEVPGCLRRGIFDVQGKFRL
jgi:hypothetical protein